MSYYLLKAFPHLRVLLYGEEKLSESAIARADVILMPVFELAKMPTRSVQAAFSSHTMSDLSEEAMVEYLHQIGRMTDGFFLCIGHDRSGDALSQVIRRYPSFRLAERRSLAWHRHRVSGSSEVECLYRIGNSKGLEG